MTTTFDVTAISRVTMAHHKGETTSKHVQTDFFLEVSDNLDKKQYLDEDNLPTKDGSKMLTIALVQGIVGNIHYANENGFRDSAEHLRYVMEEIQKGFAEVAETGKSVF